jgi:hypothetical protein
VSHIGLSDAEKAALKGWRDWIAHEWTLYVKAVGAPAGVPVELPWTAAVGDAVALPQLRRWAHVSKRSRWPLLREVVAESLRVFLEPELLDQVPLPAAPEELFELVCIVRVLNELDPFPATIRWLDRDLGQNTIRTDRLTCHYQFTVSRDDLIESGVFASPLALALSRDQVDLPARIDAFLEFAEPIAGTSGMVLEMKSGNVSPGGTVFQLLCYRAALSRDRPGPMVAWGLVEVDDGAARQWPEAAASAGDTWLFSPASAISEGMRRLGLRRMAHSPASGKSGLPGC